MSKIHNLNAGDFPDLLRRVRTLETATPLNNASIGRNGLRVYDGGVITIENGGLHVTGSATIIGALNADGTINMSGIFIASGEMRLNGSTVATGDFTISGPLLVDGNTTFNGELDINGPLTVTGDTKLDGKTDIGGNTTVTGDLDVKGPLDVTGTLDIKGKSTLQNDLTVQAGGKIKVGANMTLTPAAGGGSVEFANGTGISSSGPDLKMDATGAALLLGTQAVLTGGSSAMVMAGSSTNVSTPLFMIDRRFIASGLPAAPAGAKPNLYRDPSTGELKQIL